MGKFRFYQPPNFMNRHIHIPHRPSSLNPTSRQLKHPLPPRPSFFDESSVSHLASQRSQSLETPQNDFDRTLGEVSSNYEGQSFDRSQSDTDDHATIPIGSNPRESPDDRLNMPIKVNTVTESVSEAGRLDAYQSGASEDNLVTRDNASPPGSTCSDSSLKDSFEMSDQAIPQGDFESISKAFCQYPEPPSTLQDAASHSQGPCELPPSQDDFPQPNNSVQVDDYQRLRLSSTEPDTTDTNDLEENRRIGVQYQNRKRKARQPEEQTLKRHHTSVSSIKPNKHRPHVHQEISRSREQSQSRKSPRAEEQTHKRRLDSTPLEKKYSFATLCSHFTYLPLDKRLQFLSWLFEGVLPRCIPGTPETCEDGNMHSASQSNFVHKIEQTRRNRKCQREPREGKPWSDEEKDLLLKLRKHERRSWSEVSRLFSDRYPCRSRGSIRVYWSTTFKNKE
ncbi:hypothetical protein ACJ73_07307 [Blastomyces percursus]|uniref:Myb-like domain-containing protein n=1 Tax=Blastomyces percursus TaxID=1658174 RepID=A0A1J9QYS5_9EURO|nr:hypothetical protein ACJ73_07307 [Blastomyces percursus]